MKKEGTSLTSKVEQTFLDLGQSNFGTQKCEVCGMIYSPGKPEDERLHDSYCATKTKPIRFNSKKNDHVVFENDEIKIFKIQGPIKSKADCKYVEQKYLQVKKIMDVAMGFGQAGSSSDSSWIAFIHVKQNVLTGCVVVELIERAYELFSGKVDDDDENSLRCSEVPVPARLGIVQIWVDKRYRRQGVAKCLVDTARKHSLYGNIIRKSECAMTQPTLDGRSFGESYFDTKKLLVYT